MSSLGRLEDPLTHLHEDMPELSRWLYAAVQAAGEARLKFDEETYARFQRGLAVLESHGHIECAHVIGREVPLSLSVSDPAFLLYLAARFEDRTKMAALITALEECPRGTWLNGITLAQDLGVSRAVVQASFQLYEERGLGFCSREIGRVSYCARV